MSLCDACQRDDHANCGMQTWCECDCDPESANPVIEEYEDEPCDESDCCHHGVGFDEECEDCMLEDEE